MHPPTISTVLVHAAMYRHDWQDPQEALKQAESAIALSEQTGIPLRKVEADIAKGWALSALGDPARGIPVLESGLKGWNLMGSRIANTCWYTMLGEAYHAASRYQEASDALARARQELLNSGERVYEPQLCHVEGLLCLDANDTEGAEACFQNGLRAARDIEGRSMELRVAIDLARLWQSKGNGQEARDLLAPIYSSFTEGFDTKDLMEAKVLLEELR
jgi:predicted ATPase